MKTAIIKRISLFLALVMLLSCFTGCKEEQVQEKLTPMDIFQNIMTLTEKQDYNSVAEYCRSFGAYSIQLYFEDTDTPYEEGWTERYSETLYKLFTSYVTFKNVKEDYDEEERVGTITATFTSIDLEALNESAEYKVNTQFKNDFFKQMDYLDSLAKSKEFMSEPFTLSLEFRYKNKEWQLVDKNFLLLLTLGYYA